MKLVWVGLFLALFVAPGCATMNPYVQHNRPVSTKSQSSCRASAIPDRALDYACDMALRMEKARAQIITTRSSLTASIFPIAGIIGYNSARGFNAPTNAALAAGGFAGYSAITTLAQPDRIRIYDEGLRSAYCAIGVYENAVSQEPAQSAERLALAQEAIYVRHLIAQMDYDALGPAEQDALNSFLVVVSSIEQWLESSRPNRSLSSQLLSAIRITVSKVNSQLTFTVPDNKQMVGGALGVLQGAHGPGSGDEKALLAGVMDLPKAAVRGAVPLSPLQVIRIAVQRLADRYAQLAPSASASTVQLNLKECEYVDSTIFGVSEPTARFMLGPNDAHSGQRYTVIRGTSFHSTISGGVLPYTATYVARQGADAVEAVVKGGQLEVTIPQKVAMKEGVYVIVVNDATNQYSRSFEIVVPQN